MRPSVVVLRVGVQLLLMTSAYAEGNRTDGGGRLGKVTGGISRSTEGSGGSSGGGDSTVYDMRSDHHGWYREEWRDCPTEVMPRDFGTNPPPSTQRSSNGCNGRYIAVINSDGEVVREYQPTVVDTGPPNIDGFIGVQKVFESDAAISASLSIDDTLFRLGFAFSRYQERQLDGSQLTLTLPSFFLGVRIDGGGPTRVFLEGGAAVAKTTNEPMGDSSITGATLGVHLVHPLSAKGRSALVGDVQGMYFESDVRAYAARIGVRISVLELAFRVLDFNVGPALYGPEVGLQF